MIKQHIKQFEFLIKLDFHSTGCFHRKKLFIAY